MFEASTYFQSLASQNLLTDGQFQFCRISGIDHLEEVISQGKRHLNFLAIDDSDEGFVFENNGYFYKRKVHTVFILSRYRYPDMSDRKAKLDLCQRIFRSFLSRMVRDARELEENLVFLNTAEIKFDEIQGYFATGSTGVMFSFSVDNPLNLEMDEGEWK